MRSLLNLWHQNIVRLPLAVLYLATGFFLAVLALVWYMYAYFPLHERSMRWHAHQQNRLLESEYDSMQQQRVPLQEQRFNEAKEMVLHYQIQQPINVALQENIDLLIAHAYDTGAHITSLRMQSEKASSWGNVYRAHYALRASLQQCVNFFKKIEQENKLWSLKKLVIHSSGANQYTIEANMDITFIASPDANNEKKSI